jgi:hypothetical protein
MTAIRLMRKLLKAAFWTFLTASALLGLVLLSGIPEGYCYLYPRIGTVFATGYSDSKFHKIRLGMSGRCQIDSWRASLSVYEQHRSLLVLLI